MKIEIRNVTKVIKKTRVIDNVDIPFEGGKIYGLSGKNGCGKTMLMRLISQEHRITYRKSCFFGGVYSI